MENESGNTGGSSGDRKTSGYSGEICDKTEDLSLLMEEAKSMMKVGEYHENIVNLQGMTAKLEHETISRVSGTFFQR